MLENTIEKMTDMITRWKVKSSWPDTAVSCLGVISSYDKFPVILLSRLFKWIFEVDILCVFR